MMSIYTYNKSIAEAINELDKKLKRAKNRMNPTEWDRVSVGLDAVLHNEIGSILDNLNEIYNSYEGASTSHDTVEKATYDAVGKDICLVPDPAPSISDVSEVEEDIMEEGTLSYQVKGDGIGCLLSDIIMIDTDVYDSLCIVDDTEKAILFNRGQFIENINDASVESIKFIGLAGDITVYSIPTMYELFSKSLAEKDKEKECECDDTTAYDYVAIKADTETLMDLDEPESSTESTNNTDPISNFKRIAKIILLDKVPIHKMISDISYLMEIILRYAAKSATPMSTLTSHSRITLDDLKAHMFYRDDIYKQGISDDVLEELVDFINKLYYDMTVDEDTAIKADTETLMDLDEPESSTESAEKYNNPDAISNFKRIANIVLLDEIPILEMISDMSNLMHAIKYVIMSSSDMTLDILKAHIAYRADMYKQGISDKVLVELAEFINRLYSDVDI